MEVLVLIIVVSFMLYNPFNVDEIINSLKSKDCLYVESYRYNSICNSYQNYYISILISFT